VQPVLDNPKLPTKVLRLGEINFVNCLPVNYALSHCTNRPFSIQTINSFPADLNQKLRNSELDLAPISSYEYLKNQDQYEFLDGLSISSLKEADSVLVFVKGASGDLFMATKIFITDKSASSINLLKIILVKKYGYTYRDGQFYNSKGDSVEFSPFQTNNNDMPIKLLIGDEALIEGSKPHGYETVIDLGREWHEISNGLPMVFGLWCLNRQSGLNKGELSKFFVGLKQEGLNDYLPDIIIEAYKQTGLPKSILVKYFNDLNYDFTQQHQASLDLFKQYLKELELI
jgi:chorismate dehydratase